MAPISPGMPAGPPRKAKKPTATTKTHRFEPFTKRIARLKIDPVHRIEKDKTRDEDLSLSQSHFRTAFEHWADLNQSETYRQFSRQIRHKCESLPQILHHADTIYGLLFSAIGKKDENALEPLLNLVEAFAHDLGEKFEKYFAEIVTLVLQVAACHSAPDVIEWCFKCLAWTFRFLSRLLVPDLRPLLAIMLPYLGSKKQKHYISRFAAESLAFMLRKAAMKFPMKPQYLQSAIEYLLHESSQQWLEHGDKTYFQVGIMTLFSEAAMGVDGNVHASAPALVSTIMHCVLAEERTFDHKREVLNGTIISLLHQTGALGFEPLFELVESAILEITPGSLGLDIRLLPGLLYLIVGTREGTRITNWSKVTKLVLQLSSVGENTISALSGLIQEHLTTIAMVLQYAPMDQLLPSVQRLLQSAKNLSSASQFFAFCDIFAQLGRDRFNSLLVPHFQTYLLSRWQEDEAGLLLLLRNLHTSGFSIRDNDNVSPIYCPEAWESRIVQMCCVCALSSSDDFDVRMDGFMQISDVIRFPRDETAQHNLQDALHNLIEYGLRNPDVVMNSKARFALGRGFQTYLRSSLTLTTIDCSLWDLICKLPAQAFGLQPFLHGLRWYAGRTLPSRPLVPHEQDHLRQCLLNNLSTNAVGLKLLSVQSIKDIFSSSDEWLETVLNSILEILETPYTFKAERKLTAQLRELPRLQKRCPTMSTWSLLLPKFCMGLLSQFHSTPLRELCLAIGEMCSEPQVEDFVIGACMKWLQAAEASPALSEDSASHEADLQYPSFQCSNVISVNSVSATSLNAYANAGDLLAANFSRDHEVRIISIPSASRHLALQLLLQISQLAEKRSRLLVPLFIAAHTAKRRFASSPDAGASVQSHTLSPEVSEQAWSYSDRVLFLELFGKFTNPGVLYRSNEVHEAVFELLTNGSSEIQQAALKVLFTWKSSSVQPYEDTLLRLVDGKADSSELDLLLHLDAGQSAIEAQHRAGLMPVLLRIVFGLMISHSKSKGSQEGKRKAMLRKLFHLSHAEVILFLDISCGPLASLSSGRLNAQGLPVYYDVVPTDQQYGFLRTMHTMLDVLRTRISPFGNKILPAVLYCLARASRQINDITAQTEDNPRMAASALVRNARRSGLECLAMLFEYCDEMDWTPYMPVILAEVVHPRLSALAIETAQGISGLLRLFSIWSRSEKTVNFLQQDLQLMPSVIDCLAVPSAKDEVKLFALNDIVLNIAKLASDTPTMETKAMQIIQNNIDPLLMNLNTLLQNGPTQTLLEAIVNVLPMLAPFAASSSQAQALLSSLAEALSKGNKLSPRVKGGLMKAVQSLLQDHYQHVALESLSQTYDLSCSLFNYFKDDVNRATLCAIIGIYSQSDHKMNLINNICLDLNQHDRPELTSGPQETDWEVRPSQKSKPARLDEVHYDQQIEAFTAINELDMSVVTAQEWKPILYNLLYFARVDVDFSIRSNAVACLRNFIIKGSEQQDASLNTLIQYCLLPACEQGLKEQSETVRADFAALLGVLVQHLSDVPEMHDMRVLLVGGDAEASFYNNILHIQQHRRLRAMRRLVHDTEEGALHGRNLFRFFIPLLERFVFDINEDENSLTQKGQAIVAISSLLKWIEWPSFRATFRRYRGLMGSKVLKDRDVMKLLSGSIDALSSALKDKQSVAAELPVPPCPLSASMPLDTIVSAELKSQFIPKLTEYIKHNDEAQASLRLPASVVATKSILILPPEEAVFMIPGVLLDVCNILRSRDQQVRDEARNTLAEISILLGPHYLHLVVKELRTALNRGYQVHVLTYTMHKIIITMIPQIQPGDLDYCLAELTSLLMDDIFGSAGLDKDNDDYVSSMKEVKGNKKNSKSFGIIEALAGVTSVQKVSALLEPLRVLLTGTLSSKQQQHADEVLRRIGVGLVQNPAAGKREMLMLCYELIKDIYRGEGLVASEITTNDEKNRKRYLIQAASNYKMSSGVNTPGLYKIHRFGLDLLRSSLQRHQELLTAANLHGFLPVIGDALVAQQDDVTTSAFRLLSAIIKLPLPELTSNAALYVKEAVQIIENASNTNRDGPQAALKLVASILRERPSVDIRKRDLECLLHKVIPDLEEPDRQGSSFNLIKAIMAREVTAQTFQLPELYEMADKISAMMVVNHSRSARDVARGVYVHFLLEYPQTKKRWEKQLRFLVENLEYQYPEGRQSIMEAINMLISKLGLDRAQEPISWFFLPVVLRLVNDESQDCRDMAGALLTQMFKKANATEMDKMLSSMREWIAQTDKPALTTTGMQAYIHFLQAVGPEKEAVHMRASIENVLLAHEESFVVEDELRNHALELFSKLVLATPAATMTQQQVKIWSAVRTMLSDASTAVQSTAAGLVSAWFQDIVAANSKPELKLSKLPHGGTHGLQLDKSTMTELLKSSLRTLRRLDGTLATLGPATVRNLHFLARCFDMNKAEIDISGKAIADSDSEADSANDSKETFQRSKIPAVQYILHQLSSVLRRESENLTSAALQPKISAQELLLSLIPQLSSPVLTQAETLTTLLTPLRHLTAADLAIPKSSDPTFDATYSSLISSAHEVMEVLHTKVGDAAYVKAMTQVSREVRDRREDRRKKRRIGAVVDPERNAVRKKAKNERKSTRRKEVAGIHRNRRSLV